MLTLTLKLATTQDIIPLLPLLKELHDYTTVYKEMGDFNLKDTADTLEELIKKPNEEVAVVLAKDVLNEIQGVLITATSKSLWNFNYKTGIEIAFWLRKPYDTFSNKKQLLRAYRYWAKQVGCQSYIVGKFTNSTTPEKVQIRKL